MHRFIVFVFCVSAFMPAFTQPDPANPMRLWYRQPATNWNEALPIGNGHLAAMVFGDPVNDRVQLNEETIWSGEPGNNLIPNVYDSILAIRGLLFQGKFKEAQDLANRAFPRGAPENANYGAAYQTAGSLFMHFPGHERVTEYTRDLDIGKAVATTTYTLDGVTYTREYLAVIPEKFIVVRLSASKPGKINCTLSLQSPFLNKEVAVTSGKLTLSAKSSPVDNKQGRVKFQVQVQPVAEGGSLLNTDSTLQLVNADAVTVFIGIGTNVVDYRNISANEEGRAAAVLKQAVKSGFSTLKKKHIEAYRCYFNRVQLNLGQTDAINLPTNERVTGFARGNDPALTSLYFQFGRYLLISSSMPGSQPANLQGKWNDKLNPPWDSKYTININTEMNYWPAEVTALPEMHQPLFSMLKDLAITGRESAWEMYRARGWNTHHNTDLWRITGPVDGGFYGMWPMGGAWLSQHIWQHYLFTGDKTFLKEYFHVLKGAAEFFVDVLQEEPVHKWLVVAPSMSPENSYQSGVGISAGTTMDNQLVFDVFSNLVNAAGALGRDKAFADTVAGMLHRLAPMQIGKHGQLQEWMEDWDRTNDRHRHVSHLYGLFPSNQVSPYTHPNLFQAAKNSLVYRGDKSTGWSMGWKVNLWARLLDGNRAYKLIQDQLTPAPMETSGQNGGTYPNLLDAHPPFQIDGNFGCTSGIAEMLVQSHDGAIHLLPALPDAWPDGEVSGLITRGGFIIAMTWKNNQLQSLTLTSTIGGNCRIRSYGELKGTGLRKAYGINANPLFEQAGIGKPLQSGVAKMENPVLKQIFEYDLPTRAGVTYRLMPL